MAAARERVLPRRIKHDDLHPARQRRQRLGEVRDTDGLQRHIDVALQLGIDRNKIIFAGELQADAGKINDGDRIRSGGVDLAEKLAKRFSQRGLIKILRAGDRESRGLQRTGDQAGIIGRCRQPGRLVLVVADHQRKAHLGGVAGALNKDWRENNDKEKQRPA